MNSLMEKFCAYCGKPTKVGCGCAAHYHEDKKPHKCPVCEGQGRIFVSDPSKQGVFVLDKWQDCPPCEGKGIVWSP